MAQLPTGSLVLLFFSFFCSLVLLGLTPGANATTTFTLVNQCSYNVWVGVQPNGGIPLLASGGFALPAGESNAVRAPASWGGRFWGRTGCNFDSSGTGSCETGDCGGVLNCNGAGGTPPATLAEFTLDGANGDDFYDVSLVDGYNVPIKIQPSGGTGNCGAPGCTSNLNLNCPTALQVQSGGEVVGCKSACSEFDSAQYCCTGAYGSPTTCLPTVYSKVFKAACPTAYSYAYDDATSTFTCAGANYAIIFCPSGSESLSSAASGNTSTPSPPPPTQPTGSTPSTPKGNNPSGNSPSVYSRAHRLVVPDPMTRVFITLLLSIAMSFVMLCSL